MNVYFLRDFEDNRRVACAIVSETSTKDDIQNAINKIKNSCDDWCIDEDLLPQDCKLFSTDPFDNDSNVFY